MAKADYLCKYSVPEYGLKSDCSEIRQDMTICCCFCCIRKLEHLDSRHTNDVKFDLISYQLTSYQWFPITERSNLETPSYRADFLNQFSAIRRLYRARACATMSYLRTVQPYLEIRLLRLGTESPAVLVFPHSIKRFKETPRYITIQGLVGPLVTH